MDDVTRTLLACRRLAIEGPWPAATGSDEWAGGRPDDFLAALEAGAHFQRFGLEFSREVTHWWIDSATATIPWSGAMARPAHTAVDAQFEALRTFQDAGIDALRATASERTAPVGEPVRIDVESGTETTPEADSERADAVARDEYADFLNGTVDAIKARVEDGDVDLEGLIAAERAGKARVTLLDWLEGRLEDRQTSD